MVNFVRTTIENQKNVKILNKQTHFESIYIHIPFCEIKCPYCDFNAYSKIDDLTKNLVEAIKLEILFWSSKFKKNQIKSVYFGGGTPSWIDSEYISIILAEISKNFELSSNAEITIECNPIDLTNKKIIDYIESGINRFSVGIQSLDNKTLKFIGRNHNKAQALEGLNNIRANNIQNFSVDIMYGIPYQTHSEITETVNGLLEFDPAHFSAYSFTIEPNTPFQKFVKEKKIKELDENEYMKIFHQLYDLLEKNHYENYEISNWAKTSFESIHNLNYWDNNKFLGIGPGAHSYVNNYRFYNENSPKQYISKLNKQKSIPSTNEFLNLLNNTKFISGKENINEDTKIREYMIFSLRKKTGLNKDIFENLFKKNIDEYLSSKFTDFLDLNILVKHKDVYKFTNNGKLLSNEVFREILHPESI